MRQQCRWTGLQRYYAKTLLFRRTVLLFTLFKSRYRSNSQTITRMHSISSLTQRYRTQHTRTMICEYLYDSTLPLGRRTSVISSTGTSTILTTIQSDLPNNYVQTFPSMPNLQLLSPTQYASNPKCTPSHCSS